MKTLKLSIALAMSFAAILVVSEYVGNTGENAEGVKNFKNHIHLASCADPMDDLCEGNYKPNDKEFREKIGTNIFTQVYKV